MITGVTETICLRALIGELAESSLHACVCGSVSSVVLKESTAFWAIQSWGCSLFYECQRESVAAVL